LCRPYFASNGGNIILAQVENEYGNVENYYPNGHKYAEWAISFAKSLNIGIPWIMCQV
jgi:beta-galactosidase GanA